MRTLRPSSRWHPRLLNAILARSIPAAPRPCTTLARTAPEDLSYWQQLWQSGGGDTFTLPNVNENLTAYIPQLLPGRHKSNSRDPRAVLVPLCGMSIDLAFLASRQEAVWGVDIAEVALQEFADAYGGSTRPHPLGNTGCKAFGVRGLPHLTLVHGDFLALRPHDFGTPGDRRSSPPPGLQGEQGPFDAIWDRGGLTSIPVGLRPAYAALLYKFLRPGGRLLLEFLSTNVDPDLDESSVVGTLSAAFAGAEPLAPSGNGRDLIPDISTVRRLHRIDARSAFPEFNPPGLAFLDEIVLLAEKRSATGAANPAQQGH